jgi:hypothetical protein
MKLTAYPNKSPVMENLLLGWSWKQWEKAQAYYNLCNPAAPIVLPTFAVMAQAIFGDGPETLDDHFKVIDFWQHRRMDEPLECSIILG